MFKSFFTDEPGNGAETVEIESFWPSGVTPSVSGVVALGSGLTLRNSIVLPPPIGIGRFWANWSCTSLGSAQSIR